MPFRRKFVRRRRRFVRKRLRRRIPRMIRSNIVSMKQQSTQILTVVPFTGIGFGYSFTFANCPQQGELTQLFDQYRILAVKVTFIPQFENYFPNATPASQFAVPMIYTALDFDSIAAPGGQATVQSYSTCKTRMFNRPHVRYFKPSPLVTMSGVSNASANITNKTWMNTSSPSIPYYGLVGYINGSPLTQMPGQNVNVVITYYIQCRNVR